MRHKVKILMLGTILAISLCGCSSKDNKDVTEEIEETSESIMESIVAETKPNKEDDEDKKKETETKGSIYETLDIDNIENVGVILENPAEIELEDIPQTSGKVIDTSFDFSIYGLESTGNNDSLELFDEDYDKYMYELNNYITTTFLIKMNRVTRYLNDNTYLENYNTTVESDIHDIQISMEALDTKNTVINTYFQHDPELVQTWNRLYQEVILIREDIQNINKTNTNELDITNVISEASKTASVLGKRTIGYGIITSQNSINNSEEVDNSENSIEE